METGARTGIGSGDKYELGHSLSAGTRISGFRVGGTSCCPRKAEPIPRRGRREQSRRRRE